MAKKKECCTHEEIVARKVTVISPDGKRKVTLGACDDGAGVCVTGSSKEPCLYVGLSGGGAEVAINYPGGTKNVRVGLCLCPDGTPSVRLTPKGKGKKPIVLTEKELSALCCCDDSCKNEGKKGA